MIALNRLPGRHDSGLGLIELKNAVLENLARGIGPKRFIESAASLCDLPEPLLIQSTLDGLTACVSDEIRSAIFGAKRNERTLPRTNSHRKDANAKSRGPLCGGNPICIQFFAIGKDDQGTGLSLSLAESLFGNADRFRDICSALGDDRRVEFLERR